MSDSIVAEAERLIAEGDRRGVTLRLLGSIAVWDHCRSLRHLLPTLGRHQYRDIDLVGRSSERKGVVTTFRELGYQPDEALMASQEYGIGRLIFHGPPPDPIKVDVFLDTLRMCHRIELAPVLGLDRPTIPLAELLMSKLQIVRLTDNDIKDCIVLLAEHSVAGTADKRVTGADSDGEHVDATRISGRLADDWGFWYTATTNIERIRNAVRTLDGLSPELAEVVEERLTTLAEAIEHAPKSLRWRTRRTVGTRVLWYEEVEDVQR